MEYIEVTGKSVEEAIFEYNNHVNNNEALTSSSVNP